MLGLKDLAAIAAKHATDLDAVVRPFDIAGQVSFPSARPAIMGVINLSADSWYRESICTSIESAVERGSELRAQGADIIDIGGESTRPGSAPVPAEEEIRRVVPVIEAISKKISTPISIDTSKADVARAALDAGAAMVNDVSGLRGDADMASVVREYGAGVVIMHMQGTPETMQENPSYGDVVAEICDFFRERLEFCRERGIGQEKIILDPGIGFGKTLEHNLAILGNIAAFKKLGPPVLIGHSRKSFLGALLGLETGERDCATAMVSCLCAYGGADYLRVHDVELTRQAAAIAAAIAAGQ